MIKVSRTPFKAIEFMDEQEKVTRIEEGFKVGFALADTGEAFEGIVTKLAPKELQIKQDGETFERLFAYETLTNIQKI